MGSTEQFLLVDGVSELIIYQVKIPHLAPAQVFEHFTAPNLLRRWWAPEAEVDARPWGSFRLRWPDINRELAGEYTTFEPSRRLGFTWRWKHQPERPLRRVEVIIQPAGEGSRLILTHGSYGHSAIDLEDRQNHVDGWNHFLARLQQLEA